jgi:hypothetical protein
MSDELFDSLNPYQNMQTVSGRDENDLVNELQAIRTPFKIDFIAVNPRNGRFIAFIRGHLPKRRGRPPKKPKE